MDKCREIQQNFYENLGTRDYDCFQGNEDTYLKLKIGFTVFGVPKQNEALNNFDGDLTATKLYDVNQNILINKLYSVIRSNSISNEHKDQTFISFLFNCCLFPRKKKEGDDKIGIFPVFRVRKCSGSPTNKNCCVFIDEHSRIYKNWADYLKNNKIPKAIMCLPKIGKYQGTEDDKVILEFHYSPATSPAAIATEVADVTTSAASLISGGIALGSLIPAITVAPILLTGALVTGAGVGIYSIIRSSIKLHDRNTHGQSISVANNEARNCYLNIAAGATSVVTTGATKITSFAISKGVTIGEGAATALLSVNAINLTVNGCNVVNSIYLIANDIKNKKNPSPLDLLHLTTTILFFGHAVVNFKSACTIYTETTASRSFTDIIRTRSQDLLMKAKTKFFKADMTTTENNASIDVVENSADFYSNAISCTIKEKASDAVANTAMNLLMDLIREIDLEGLQRFGKDIIENRHNAQALCKIIFARFELPVQKLLLNMLTFLLNDVIQEAYNTLQKLFPKSEKVVVLLNFIIQFLKYKASEMEINYHKKKAETLRNLNISEEEYDRNGFGMGKLAQRSLTVIIKMIGDGAKPQEILFKEMVSYFWEWLKEKTVNFAIEMSQKNNSHQVISIQRKKLPCLDCGGFYYID